MTQGPELKHIFHYKQIKCGAKIDLQIDIPNSPPRIQNHDDLQLMKAYHHQFADSAMMLPNTWTQYLINIMYKLYSNKFLIGYTLAFLWYIIVIVDDDNKPK